MALLPNYIIQIFDNQGIPCAGCKLFFYEPGTGNAKKKTTNGSGGADNPNPIILDSAGRPDNAGTAIDIFLLDGQSYKIVLAPANDTDPPASPIRTVNNIADIGGGSGEWINSTTATYVSATQFTLGGDQTANYAVGTRIKLTGGADRYGRVSVSSYVNPTTTITVVDVVDAGGGTQTLHASMSNSFTHIITVTGYKGATRIEGATDAGGTADALTGNFYPSIALADKTTVLLRAAFANATTTPTFSPNGATALTIVKSNNIAVFVGDIAGAGHVLQLQHNVANNNWTLLNPSIDQSTEASQGTIKISTQAIALAGTNNTDAMTSLRVAEVLAVPLRVAQGALKTTTVENTTTTALANVDLAVGQYAFLLLAKASNATYVTQIYGSAGGNVTTQVLGYTTRMGFGSTNAANTASIQIRYVQASPPYNLGDGDIPLFIFVTINKTTKKIISTSSAPEAPWHFNGPTNITANRYTNGAGYRERKDMREVPFTYEEALKDPVKLQEYVNAMCTAKTYLEEITQEIKNRDMPLLPTPRTTIFDKSGNDITGNTVTVMLDPVCDLAHHLAEMRKHSGFFLGELLHDDYFVIDNTPSGLKGPPGILVPSFRWKKT